MEDHRDKPYSYARIRSMWVTNRNTTVAILLRSNRDVLIEQILGITRQIYNDEGIYTRVILGSMESDKEEIDIYRSCKFQFNLKEPFDPSKIKNILIDSLR